MNTIELPGMYLMCAKEKNCNLRSSEREREKGVNN